MVYSQPLSTCWTSPPDPQILLLMFAHVPLRWQQQFDIVIFVPIVSFSDILWRNTAHMKTRRPFSKATCLSSLLTKHSQWAGKRSNPLSIHSTWMSCIGFQVAWSLDFLHLLLTRVMDHAQKKLQASWIICFCWNTHIIWEYQYLQKKHQKKYVCMVWVNVQSSLPSLLIITHGLHPKDTVFSAGISDLHVPRVVSTEKWSFSKSSGTPKSGILNGTTDGEKGYPSVRENPNVDETSWKSISGWPMSYHDQLERYGVPKFLWSLRAGMGREILSLMTHGMWRWYFNIDTEWNSWVYMHLRIACPMIRMLPYLNYNWIRTWPIYHIYILYI